VRGQDAQQFDPGVASAADDADLDHHQVPSQKAPIVEVDVAPEVKKGR